jgi:hypothetical protein
MACIRLFAYGSRSRTTTNASPPALRGLDAPGENLKLMPLARLSMPCFNECAIDPHHHSLDWFGDNTRMIDFLAELFFNAFADSERSVTCRGKT